MKARGLNRLSLRNLGCHPRTVRYGVNGVKEIDVVTEELYLTDARKSFYKLTGESRDDSPDIDPVQSHDCVASLFRSGDISLAGLCNPARLRVARLGEG
jgi:hypothetical protein